MMLPCLCICEHKHIHPIL